MNPEKEVTVSMEMKKRRSGENEWEKLFWIQCLCCALLCHGRPDLPSVPVITQSHDALLQSYFYPAPVI